MDARYESLLNIDGSGMMGYIRIPKIKVEIPIYHGTSESVLQAGVGHFWELLFLLVEKVRIQY